MESSGGLDHWCSERTSPVAWILDVTARPAQTPSRPATLGAPRADLKFKRTHICRGVGREKRASQRATAYGSWPKLLLPEWGRIIKQIASHRMLTVICGHPDNKAIQGQPPYTPELAARTSKAPWRREALLMITILHLRELGSIPTHAKILLGILILRDPASQGLEV